MTEPTTLPPPLARISTSSPLGDGPTAAPDDSALLRLAIWLAEVSADAAPSVTGPLAPVTPAGPAAIRTREAAWPAAGSSPE